MCMTVTITDHKFLKDRTMHPCLLPHIIKPTIWTCWRHSEELLNWIVKGISPPFSKVEMSFKKKKNSGKENNEGY